MSKVKLVVVYDKKVISIPFPNTESLDIYTVMYNNEKDMGLSLNQILDLKLEHVNIKRIYVTRTRMDKNNQEYMEILPVKYNFDIFDLDAVKIAYCEYLISNIHMLKSKYNGLDKITNNYMNKYHKTILSHKDIYNITSLYLESSYDRYRDTYFFLIAKGIKIKTNKPQKPLVNRTNLTKYDMKGAYLESLKEYSLQGKEEHAKVMEELSKYDQDELSRIMTNENYNLFDNGKIDRMTFIEDEAIVLKSLADKSLFQEQEQFKGKKR